MASDEEERGNRSAAGRKSPSEKRGLTIVGNRVDSRDLFLDTRDIVILHGSDAYHLRLTSQNKLILTK